MVACPCALGLAVPVAGAVALGRAPRLGLLVRHADTLERVSSITAMVLDKTGTLTLGKPVLRSVMVFGAFSEPAIRAAAVSLARQSAHSVSLAIVSAHSDLTTAPMNHGQVLAGRGVTGIVPWLGQPAQGALGSKQFLQETMHVL